MPDGISGYWYSRFVFERALALIYFVAFLCAANQFVPLLGEHGLTPAARFVRDVPFRASPSLFFFASSDAAFRVAAWAGVALSIAAFLGLGSRLHALAPAAIWFTLWLLYLSFVNVGQTFYGFGWETLLLETGFFAMFLGSRWTMPTVWMIGVYRWLLFRVMFGAGLIKLRGDACWRDLTCLDYYFETQPMPNPLTWYFHWLPHRAHAAGVDLQPRRRAGGAVLVFAPQPIAGIGGAITIVFQLTLIVSGNLSWLNWITIVLVFRRSTTVGLPGCRSPCRRCISRCSPSASSSMRRSRWSAIMSVGPIANMLSPGQIMNTSFDPLHLVNTYGAFGSITRTRNEIVVEGTDDQTITPATTWREYEFKGKPGDPSRRPPQVAPYHLRLDWLMWFAAFSTPDDHPWFSALLARLLQGDRDVLSLLRTNPFPIGRRGSSARSTTIPLHDARRTSADRPVVEAAVDWRLLPACVARSRAVSLAVTVWCAVRAVSRASASRNRDAPVRQRSSSFDAAQNRATICRPVTGSRCAPFARISSAARTRRSWR